MRVWLLPSILGVCAGCFNPAISTANAQDSVQSKLKGDAQLHNVLIEARDAVVAETRIPDNGYSTAIEEDVKRVTRYLLQTGNRSDVVYLQEHLEQEYSKRIRTALEPTKKLEDFEKRAKAVELETELFDHDEDIELIVEQEIERGFLDDALQNAMKLRMRSSETRMLGKVALRAYKKHKVELAIHVVQVALERAKSTDQAPDLFLDHGRMMAELSRAWFDGGYSDGALRARQAMKEWIEENPKWYATDGSELGGIAAEQGDLKMAEEVQEHLTNTGDREYLQTQIQCAQAKMAGGAQGANIAQEMQGGYFKCATLRDIAKRQIDSGDKVGAAKTLKIALEAADQDEQFRVIRMADIAWDQIEMGDRAAAEATIEAGLQDNEKHRLGGDQANGWMMLAEDLAHLGQYDRAVQVAQRNGAGFYAAEGLKLVAYHETQAGHAEWAVAWARGLEDPESRARAFLGVAGGLIEHVTGQEEDIVKN